MAAEQDKEAASPGTQASAYLDWLAAYRATIDRDRDRSYGCEVHWSWLRLAAFAVGVAAVVLLRGDLPAALAAAALGVVAFLGSILRHTKWESKRHFAERTLVVIEESLVAATRRDCPARDWQRPDDPTDASAMLPTVCDAGPTWALTDQERDDLDLYGAPVGIFGLVNRTSTALGARRLRDWLDAPCLSCEQILRRQEAVRGLAESNEPRARMMAALASLRRRSASLDRLVQLLSQTERPPRLRGAWAIRAWSAVSALLVALSVARIGQGQYGWARVLAGVILLNSVIQIVFRRLVRAVAPWPGLRGTLQAVLAVAEHARDELPDEAQLGVLKNHLREVVEQARIPSLCAWLEWAGLHGIVRGLLNAVVLLDLHVAEAVLTRIVPIRDVLLRGLSAELPTACYPQPTPDPGIAIEQGKHPLILPDEAAPNSVRLTPATRTWVITGPNAAGKSTFLRMVGVNVLLAQVGAAVPAQSMIFSPARLMTDVRIRDDLAKHESYFLSEVRRLRRMVLDAAEGAPLFGLIDEPFRGTNSQERTAAGIALLEYLVQSSNLFLVATHEEVLARTAGGAVSAENYHFQEHLTEEGIRFDYLLRPGAATTRTAIRIIEQEGYPKALLDRARALMSD
jgi:ABC-type lipoprotein export system ATPase subunit